MTPERMTFTAAALAGLMAGAGPAVAQRPDERIGVVCHIRVLSDKAEDVSSPEAWKATYINGGMTDADKALAIWKTVVKYGHQTVPPQEGLCPEGHVHDPFKLIQVYGYGMCCDAACSVEGLARYLGLRARGRLINAHSVSEIFYDDSWHMSDGSQMNYFIRADGRIGSVDDLCASVNGWWEAHPEAAKTMRGNDAALRAWAANEGWKKGPKLLTSCPFYDRDGLGPAGSSGWHSAMRQYDIPEGMAGISDYGPSMGYRLNVQLRVGEKITRNWFNRGLHVNMPAEEPDILRQRAGMGLQRKLGDPAPGRVGNGTHEYDVPLEDGAFRLGALTAENFMTRREDGGGPAAAFVKDAAKPAILVIRMPSSYPYLSGQLTGKSVVGQGGSIAISLSDNNGLDWKPVARIEKTGDQNISLTDHVFRRYDYRIRFELNGAGTGWDSLKLSHDIQHSQAPLPALLEGKNEITFSAGPSEGTVTIEANMGPPKPRPGQPLSHMDFHPVLNGLSDDLLRVGPAGRGEALYTIVTPGEIARLRLNVHYRAPAAADGYEVQVSVDGGRTFRTVARLGGPTRSTSRYLTVTGIPPLTREARIRFVGTGSAATCVFSMRLDADYEEPRGGFRPVKVTYLWEEGGTAKRHQRVMLEPQEQYVIRCGAGAVPLSFAVELASPADLRRWPSR